MQRQGVSMEGPRRVHGGSIERHEHSMDPPWTRLGAAWPVYGAPRRSMEGAMVRHEGRHEGRHGGSMTGSWRVHGGCMEDP